MPIMLPTKLKALKGTLRPDRVNPHEPQPDPAIPEPPDWLYGDGLEEWHRVTRMLGPEGLGVITKLDRGVLAIYCLLWQMIADEARGQRPPLTQATFAQYRRAASSLGLDPQGRIRLRPGMLEAGSGKQNPFTRFDRS